MSLKSGFKKLVKVALPYVYENVILWLVSLN